MTIEEALEVIRKVSEEARKVGATEHQIIAAAAVRQEEKIDIVASAGAKVLVGR